MAKKTTKPIKKYRVNTALYKNMPGHVWLAGDEATEKELKAAGVGIDICLEKKLITPVEEPNGEIQTE